MTKFLKLNQVEIVRATHHQDIYDLIKKKWNADSPLILCPPGISQLPNLENIQFPEQMILGLFTSGTSSGNPRLVIFSKKNLITSLEAIRKLFLTSKIDHIFCYPQPTHVFGLVLGYLQSIIYQIPISFADGIYSQKSHQLWNEKLTSGTLTLGAPPHFFDLIKFNEKNNLTPHHSYSSIAGGAPVSIKLWNDMKSVLNIENPSIGYGASEASPGICHLPPGVAPSFSGDVGQLLEGVQIRDINSQGFYFKGNNACLGIVENNRFESREWNFIPDQMEKFNHYCVTGRSDLTINRGGVKFQPEVIEAALMEADIKGLIIPIHDPRLGQDLVVLVEVEEERQTSHFKAQIKNFFLIHHDLKLKDEFIIFDQIALNNNLKIDRKESLKRIIKVLYPQLPLATQILQPFMPHRGSAVWVDEITAYKLKQGSGRVYIDENKLYMSGSTVRSSALIEFVAQTFGYSSVLEALFNSGEISRGENTFIAEVRNVEFTNQEILTTILNEKAEDRFFDVLAQCTHDFAKVKVIKGEVWFKDKRLVELDMKLAIF